MMRGGDGMLNAFFSKWWSVSISECTCQHVNGGGGRTQILTWHEHGEVFSPARVRPHERGQYQAPEEVDALYYVDGR